MLDDIHNFCLVCLSCRAALSVLYVYESAWALQCWCFYLLTLANRQITINVWWGGKWWKYVHDRQIMPNNFVDKEKEAKLSVNTSQNFPWFKRPWPTCWTPGRAKRFLRVAKIFKLCPAHFSREGEKFCSALHEIFLIPQDQQPLIFCRLFQCGTINFIFDKII